MGFKKDRRPLLAVHALDNVGGGFPDAFPAVGVGTNTLRTPIALNACYPNGSATNASNQYMARTVLYCPAGAKSMSLVFAGTRIATATETDLTGASPVNISYAVIPAPWDATVSYAVGQKVSGDPTASNSSSPVYACLVANANSRPTPGNTNWGVGTQPVRIQCTILGQPALGATTTVNTAGTTITNGYFETDPFAPIGATGPCWMEVDIWVKPGGGLSFGIGQSYSAAAFATIGSTTPDLTTTGYQSPSNALSITIRPTLALGIPAIQDTGKTVAYFSHSIGTGAVGGQQVNSFAITSGGTGYTTADIGKRFAIDNTGATATSIAFTAQGIITAVGGGAVTGVKVYNPGSYANSGAPTGASNTVAIDTTVGSGLTVTPTMGSGAYDPGNSFFAQGAFQRALSEAGIRYTLFVSSGDTLLGYATRSYSRMALAKKANCSSAIIDLGVNDLSAGQTLVQMQTNAIAMANQLLGLGYKGVFLATVLPSPTSTDGFATIGTPGNGQTVPTYNAIAQAYNTWVRSVPAPFAGMIDQAAAIEVGGATAPTGQVIVNGTIGYILIDGKHPTPSAVPIIRDAIKTQLAQLL